MFTLRLYVDMSALANNLVTLKSMTKSKICAVVKADAYGLGLGVLEALDADEFAVSSIVEAYDVVKYTDKPINILSSPDKTVRRPYSAGIYPTVSTQDDIAYVSEMGGAYSVNIKINTGMNRYGASPTELRDMISAVEKCGLRLKSVFSHIYMISAAKRQFEIFEKCIAPFRDYIPQKHILSSNFVELPEYMHLDMVRPGIVLYGYGSEKVESTVTAACAVAQIRKVGEQDNIGYGNCLSGKERTIAVLSAGYGDGLARNVTDLPRYVEIQGKLCRIVGQICMDAMFADVSGMDVSVGETAYVYGKLYGVESAAAACGTIGYEILTSLTKRVERNYVWREYGQSTNERKIISDTRID